MKISSWALRHSVTVTLLAVGSFLFGVLALFYLNKEFVPPILLPAADVITLWPGAGADDVEREITSVLENEFSSTPNLRKITSESREGVSLVTLQFVDKTDNTEIIQNLRNRIDRVLDDLPDGILGKPEVRSWGANVIPIFTFLVSSPQSADTLGRYVEDTIIPRIYTINGVAEANSFGLRKSEISVEVDTAAAALANVTPTEIYGAITRRNAFLPTGLVSWEGQETSMRVSGEFQTLDDIANTTVGANSDGAVQLKDVATITEAREKPEEYIRSDGRNLVVVQVTRRDDGNSIRISRQIRDMLKSIKEDGYQYTVLSDDSKTVRGSLVAVLRSALLGILMAIVILHLFLRNWRFTLVVAISLPTCMVLTMVGMWVFGQSVNILTLAGLTVSLGMVVDASIVVLENIYTCYTRGETVDRATEIGSTSVSKVVFASTVTSVCVFIPLLFLTGIIGKIMIDLALTIIISLTSSMFAALMIVPPLARKIMSSGLENGVAGRAEMHQGKIFLYIERFYCVGLKRSLKISGIVLLSAVIILIASVGAAGIMGLSFIPEADYDELFVALEMPAGSSLEDTRDRADKAEQAIRREVPEIRDIVFYVGMESDLSGKARKRDNAWGHILLVPSRQRKRSFRQIIDQLNTELPSLLPGVQVTVLNGGMERSLALGTDGSGYRVQLTGASWDELRASADQVEEILRNDRNIVSVTQNVPDERQTLTVQLDSDSLDAGGINASEISTAARIAFEGVDLGEFRPPGETERNIRLVTDLKGAVPDSSTLLNIVVRNGARDFISLDSVADVNVEWKTPVVRRRDRARSISVVGYTRGENIREINERLRAALADTPLPGGIKWRINGVSGLLNDSIASLGIVFLISLFLVYGVMATQANRFVQPLVIMVSIPFSFIGVVGGLAAFGSSMSVISFMGLIALGGIVVNNALVQMDLINVLRAQGEKLENAVVQGAVQRLRPVLMTTMTTFICVLPLSFARGDGARIYAPFGQAIAGGLLTSTIVTLFLVPNIYYLVEKRKDQSRVSGSVSLKRLKKEVS